MLHGLSEESPSWTLPMRLGSVCVTQCALTGIILIISGGRTCRAGQQRQQRIPCGQWQRERHPAALRGIPSHGSQEGQHGGVPLDMCCMHCSCMSFDCAQTLHISNDLRSEVSLHTHMNRHHNMQVVSPLRDGLYDDFDLIEGLWDHALRCSPSPFKPHAALHGPSALHTQHTVAAAAAACCCRFRHARVHAGIG